ncbi:PepSY domain-containing protein [Rhodopseudomonas sp. B29]|uniref:PepSY-associated TM helix domain-containing protein n=1 Tax=Rhodopseudomonas sp. B29 TaxID=95607 RepID=UPI0003474142|nr:PepSY-associated TM helix domain-containing protein [Rhodopseudomonas sp. B29]
MRHVEGGIRQRMAGLHTWTGLLLGWVLYAMFLTGTVSYFKDELSQWMRPELPALTQRLDEATTAQRVADELGRLVPDASMWSIKLPDAHSNSVYAFWRSTDRQAPRGGFGEGIFDPQTGSRFAARGTLGGDFFYRFHFQFYYMSPLWGRWLAGIAAMFMLIAIIAGVITHKKIFTDFFTFRWGKGQRSWLDAHNALSVFGLPFHLMITYTGLVTLMALYMPWGEHTALKTAAERQQLAVELSPFGALPSKRSGQTAPLGSIADMVRQAEARWGEGMVGRVNAALPGDAGARVVVTRGDAGRVSMSPSYLEFDGTNGRLLAVHDHVGAAAETRGVLYALHLGRFGDIETRWLYFLVSFMGTAMVGTGLVMWTVKRRQKLADTERPHFGFRVVERLNIASIAGLSVAMTSFLWANRLLPHPMQSRAEWEIHVFFIVWGLTLLYALLRPARAAWVELLAAAAVLLALLPVLNALTTSRPLWHSVAVGDWVFAGVDLMCWALAALHGVLAFRTARRGRVTPAGKPRDFVAIASAERAR